MKTIIHCEWMRRVIDRKTTKCTHFALHLCPQTIKQNKHQTRNKKYSNTDNFCEYTKEGERTINRSKKKPTTMANQTWFPIVAISFLCFTIFLRLIILYLVPLFSSLCGGILVYKYTYRFFLFRFVLIHVLFMCFVFGFVISYIAILQIREMVFFIKRDGTR